MICGRSACSSRSNAPAETAPRLLRPLPGKWRTGKSHKLLKLNRYRRRRPTTNMSGCIVPQYTPQQLVRAHAPRRGARTGLSWVVSSQAGSIKFGGSTLIGNWQEDATLEESRLMDYLDAKESGDLAVLRRQARLSKQLTPVHLSQQPTDGELPDGATILLHVRPPPRARVPVPLGLRGRETRA